MQQIFCPFKSGKSGVAKSEVISSSVLYERRKFPIALKLTAVIYETDFLFTELDSRDFVLLQKNGT